MDTVAGTAGAEDAAPVEVSTPHGPGVVAGCAAAGYVLGMRRSVLALSMLLGCATTRLSAKAAQVTVLEARPGAECAVVGDVGGSADPFFGGLKPESELVESARNDARNEAAKQGATHLVFTGEPTRWASGTFGGGHAVTVSAVAYRCGNKDDARSPTGELGCFKDTDCKGDRICKSHTCVDPAR